MNTSVNEYNYRFKLTDYALFDRNRERKVAIYGRVLRNTKHSCPHLKTSCSGTTTK